MDNITRPTYMQVDISNFKHNIDEIRKIVGIGVDLMPVIKANAYGTYVNTRLDVINDFNIVAVATVDEGVFIRKLGFKKDIFVLNQPYKDEIEKIIENDIVVGISSKEFADALGKTGKDVRVHMEIETGMGRTGVSLDNVKEYILRLNSNVIIEGVYTHFSSADSDEAFSRKQLDTFKKAVDEVKSICPNIKYVHAAASNAILNINDSFFNLVRPGIIMYGYPACNDTLEKINIKPVASLMSKITFLKTVKEGTSIGYNQGFVTTKETKVATIPIGYADGFRRTFSNNGEVIIKGQRAPIIGKVCMDSFMCDVTEIEDVSEGDDVIIWDNKDITLESLAEKCNTINYEILSCISNRVPRKFI